MCPKGVVKAIHFNLRSWVSASVSKVWSLLRSQAHTSDRPLCYGHSVKLLLFFSVSARKDNTCLNCCSLLCVSWSALQSGECYSPFDQGYWRSCQEQQQLSLTLVSFFLSCTHHWSHWSPFWPLFSIIFLLLHYPFWLCSFHPLPD